jgi:hypothetical protein
MPGSLARPPTQWAQRQRKEGNSQVSSQKELEEDLGGGIVNVAKVLAAPAPPSSWPRHRNAAAWQRPSDHHITTSGRRQGCRQCHPTGDGDGDLAGGAKEKEQ